MSSSVNKHNSDDVHRLNDINRWLEINYLDLLFKIQQMECVPMYANGREEQLLGYVERLCRKKQHIQIIKWFRGYFCV